MEQLGINSEDLDLDELMKQVQRLQGSGGISFGFTPADRDPEAAWRTTIAAARRIASELGPDPELSSGGAPGHSGCRAPGPVVAGPGNPVQLLRAAAGGTAPRGVDRGHLSGVAASRRTDHRGLADALQRGTAQPEDPQFAGLSSMLAP